MAEPEPKVPYSDTNDVGVGTSSNLPVQVNAKKLVPVGTVDNPMIAPHLSRKAGGSTAESDVPTSDTPTAADPGSMIATKAYVDDHASIANAGSNSQHVYVSGGEVKAATGTIGSELRPIYIRNGTMTATDALAPINSPSFTGYPSSSNAPTANAHLANKKYVDDQKCVVTVTPKLLIGTESAVISITTASGTTNYSIKCNSASNTDTLYINVPLLTPMFFDYQVNDGGWVYSDPVAAAPWILKGTAPEIYNHLAAENGATDQTDTYILSNGTRLDIPYKLTSDGHRICPAAQASNLKTLLDDANIGVAWYYVLDTTNQKFMLPRTKYGLHGKMNYVKRPTSDSKEEQLRLYFFNSSSSTMSKKMDKVVRGNGDFTADAVARNVAVYGSGGQVVDSGHGIQEGSSPDTTGLATKKYVDERVQMTSILGKVYPTGSIYVSINNTTPFQDIDGRGTSFGTWTLIGQGKTLWGYDGSKTPGTNISAGLPSLPNHTHTYTRSIWSNHGEHDPGSSHRGGDGTDTTSSTTWSSHAIYGNSDTVQPPAVVVCFWQRTE